MLNNSHKAEGQANGSAMLMLNSHGGAELLYNGTASARILGHDRKSDRTGKSREKRNQR